MASDRTHAVERIDDIALKNFSSHPNGFSSSKLWALLWAVGVLVNVCVLYAIIQLKSGWKNDSGGNFAEVKKVPSIFEQLHDEEYQLYLMKGTKKSCDHETDRSHYDLLIERETKIACETSSRARKNESVTRQERYDSSKECFPRYLHILCPEENKKGSGGLYPDDRMLLSREYYFANSIIEFGIGESSTIAASVNVPRYIGVDSSGEWIDMTRAKVPPRFRFILADIGATGKWGSPLDPDLDKIPLSYQLAPLRGESESFDLYLVDGRFRVSCVIAAFLHAISANNASTRHQQIPQSVIQNTRVMLHDYGRAKYHVVETFAKVVDQATQLVVLQLKENFTDPKILYDLWHKHYSVQ